MIAHQCKKLTSDHAEGLREAGIVDYGQRSLYALLFLHHEVERGGGRGQGLEQRLLQWGEYTHTQTD